MGLWSFLFGKPVRRALILGDGEFDFPIVGESNYQDALETLCGGRTEDGAEFYCAVVLVPEPSNPHDRNAVAAFIKGHKVGYLSREVAADAVRAFRSARVLEGVAGAVIVGGWERPRKGRAPDRGHFGVRLDVAWPIKFKLP